MWPFRRSDKPPLGPRGEKIARRFLRRQGMKILAENYRSGAAEIDLIALDRSTRGLDGAETICFVEVKTRSCDTYTDPESAVNAEKQRRIRKAAGHYLAGRDAEGFNVRYDIVAIVLRDGQEAEIRHLPGAF
ncbi:MAG TPA: YraN family protein [Phycisphaerales bacterium]|nr:YraN family protein [Phycisphaerales bacterium]